MDYSTAIEGIMKIRESIHKQHLWNDPVALSDKMMKLSVYNSYLADELAPLHKVATDKSYELYTASRADGRSISGAEQDSRGGSTQERADYENLKNIYSATGNLITVLQSRLKVIENTRRQEGL